MVSLGGLVDVGKRVAGEFSGKNVSFMAAGIAYNAFVSLVPLLILLLLLVSAVGGGLEARLVTVAEDALPGPIADVVTGIFAGEESAASASAVGLVVLVWGTLKIFRGLDTAFSEIYETERANSIGDQLVDGLVVFAAIALAVAATVGASSAFALLAETVPYVGVLSPLVLVAGLVLAFFPMYYRFPDADLGWREVLPGTVFAAVGWALLQGLFQVYILFSGDGSGSFFGGVIVVVTWLYFSGLVLLLGAVLNAVIDGHATGAPGGVGRGAAQSNASPQPGADAENRKTLSGEALASYLRDLRGRLTGQYEEVEAAGEAVETARRPAYNVAVEELPATLRTYRPILPTVEAVEVIEGSRRDGDEIERTITLRWRTTEPGADD